MGLESGTGVMAMQGLGAGMQAVGAYRNSKAAEIAFKAQSQVNENNAVVAEWQSQDAERRGQVAAGAHRTKVKQFKGAQRARLAANGVDLGEGSAVEILTDTDYFGEVDAGTILDNAAREAWGYRTQAQNFTTESTLLRNRGDAESPNLAMTTSLIGGATRMSSTWYTVNRSKREEY